MQYLLRIGKIFLGLVIVSFLASVLLFFVDPCFSWQLLVSQGNIYVLRFLVPNVLDPNIRFWHNNTILHVLPKNSKLELVEFLINQIGTVNLRNDYGETPLHALLNWRELNSKVGLKLRVNIETIKLLLDKGADINATGGRGDTLIDYVMTVSDEDGRREILQEILKRKPIFNERTSAFHTPFSQLIVFSNPQDLRIFFKYGVSPNRTLNGQTLLHLAVASENKRNEDILQTLIENGANVNSTNASGETPLDLAIKLGLNNKREILEKHGAKKSSEINSSNTSDTFK